MGVCIKVADNSSDDEQFIIWELAASTYGVASLLFGNLVKAVSDAKPVVWKGCMQRVMKGKILRKRRSRTDDDMEQGIKQVDNGADTERGIEQFDDGTDSDMEGGIQKVDDGTEDDVERRIIQVVHATRTRSQDTDFNWVRLPRNL